jgi:hypothetical protein
VTRLSARYLSAHGDEATYQDLCSQVGVGEPQKLLDCRVLTRRRTHAQPPSRLQVCCGAAWQQVDRDPSLLKHSA